MVGSYYFVKISERQKQGLFKLKERYGIPVTGIIFMVLKKVAEYSDEYFSKLKDFLLANGEKYRKERKNVVLLLGRKDDLLYSVSQGFWEFLQRQMYSFQEAKVIAKFSSFSSSGKVRKDCSLFVRLLIDYVIANPQEFFWGDEGKRG
ncbi:MAG: hypothetical protein ABIL77_02655 [candidate division WOR-3 bacterium]